MQSSPKEPFGQTAQPLTKNTAWDQLEDDYMQTGIEPKAPHDYLYKQVTIQEPGYAYVYVSNESPTLVDVYFDDIEIVHEHSPIVAGADFYPFGLPMDGREITDEYYRYGYQGQYAEKDTTTGWNEFELRMYDARFGRWLSPDPYGQFWSPYLAMGNNPISSVDPDGGFCCSWAELLALSEAYAITGTAINSVAGAVSAGVMTGVFSGMASSTGGGGVLIEFPGRFSNLPEIPGYGFSGGSEPYAISSQRPIDTSPLTDIASPEFQDTFWKYAKMGDPNLEGLEASVGFLGAIASGSSAQIKDKGVNLLLATVTAIPIGRVGRFARPFLQAHHVIPRAVIRDFGLKSIQGFSVNGLRNIKRLPFPFHAWHPQYNKYVANRLRQLGPNINLQTYRMS